MDTLVNYILNTAHKSENSDVFLETLIAALSKEITNSTELPYAINHVDEDYYWEYLQNPSIIEFSD